MVLEVFISLLLLAVCFERGITQQEYTVYFSSNNGTTTVSCWSGEQEVNCQNVERVVKETMTDISSNEFVIQSLSQNLDQQHIPGTTDCPTWMYYSNETNRCICGADHHGMVKCNATLEETYILDCHRMTYDSQKGEVVAGLSFYGCLNQAQLNEIYHLVPANRSQINRVMCGQFNRDGRLCGACMNGYSPLVYSYQLYCKNCSEAESKYNWAKFIAVAFLPLTGFYIFVVLFKFNVNSPQLQGFVLFVQMTVNPVSIRIISSGWKFGKVVTVLTKLIATLYGIWNLDYFRTLYPDICLQLSTLQALSLDYVIAFYPLVLILTTYIAIKLYSMECRVVLWMWKPIRWCLFRCKVADDIKTSMIDVFATFLLLSYGKILSVNFDLLAFTVPIDSSGRSVGRYLYYDASYKYFGTDHLPYGIMATLSFTIFNILPFLLLLFYPMSCFQKLLNCFQLSHLALHTFVDSFAGCYKDGTEPGTRDCRYFAALFLLLRILNCIIYQTTLSVAYFGWIGLIIVGFTTLFIVVQPYKTTYKRYNLTTAAMLLMLNMVVIASMNVNTAFIKVRQTVTVSAIVVATLIGLPQLYTIGLCIAWIYKQIFQKHQFCKLNTEQMSMSESSLLLATEH